MEPTEKQNLGGSQNSGRPLPLFYTRTNASAFQEITLVKC